MHMHNLSFDADRHHYAFGKYDRITIEGQTYRTLPHSRNEEGWLLELDDGSGRCGSFTHQELSRLGSMKRIRVEHNFHAPEIAKRRLLTGDVLISELEAKSAARLTKKNAYIEAFLEMEREKRINRTDAAILANRFELRGRAMDYAAQFRGGENVQQSQDFNKDPSPRTLRRWHADHRASGIGCLVDAMNRRGNRNRLMGPEQLALMMGEVRRYASEDRPSMKTIHENVSVAFDARNEARVAEGLHPFPIPSYETVRRAIHMLDPFEVAVARDGIEEARKKFMPVGEGLRLTRPLERVEIDENTIDIISLTKSWGLLALLTEEERKILGLDGSKARWFVTVAICATTRCILGMAFSRSAKEKASVQVLQMILRDKGKWADAAGSLGFWDMHGTPVLIVTDNGAAFKSELFRTACADLGITTLRAPAGMAQMRARNERFFDSLNTGVLPRLPGRTFGSIRERGNADPEARAALTFDDLAFCLVRWIVDIYHNTSHAGLGGETPLHCWRRLAAEWGVQPPPDMGLHRVIFGERLPRKLSREGVTVLGLRYHSEALARLMTNREERNVEVRWHPDDIGTVTVYAGEQKFEVGTVLPGFDGVSARQWVAATRELKAANAGRKSYDRQMIHAAITAIESRSSAATRMAGLLVDEWSPERIRDLEASLYIGFNAGEDKPKRPATADGIGRSIPDPEEYAPRPATLPVMPATDPAPRNPTCPTRPLPCNPGPSRSNPMSNPTEAARILRKLRKLRVDTPRDTTFITHLDRLLCRDEAGNLLPEPQRFSAGRETHGVMVVDGAGGGKTTLISRALERHPVLSGATGRHYLDASVPSPATFKSMTAALLQRSGYPVITANREGWGLWETLRGRLKDLGITVLWIDEAHDLFCADRRLILRALKSLMQGDEAVIPILSGTERLHEIVRSDPQVQHRLSTLILPPVSEVTDGASVVRVIREYCRIAGLEPPLDADLIPRLFHGARYRFGRCIETLVGAIEFALEAGASRLDIAHFAEFWAMQEGCPPGGNVFLAPDWPQIDPDRNETDTPPVRARARRRRA